MKNDETKVLLCIAVLVAIGICGWLAFLFVNKEALTAEQMSATAPAKIEQYYLDEIRKAVVPAYVEDILVNKIPVNIKTPKFWRKAIKANYYAARIAPEDVFDRETVLFLIDSDDGLKYAPSRLINKEISNIALGKNLNHIWNIPKEVFDEQTALYVLNQENGTRFFKYVPEKAITRRVAVTAVSKGGLLLGNIPAKLVDRELCLIAVRQNGAALMHVPWKMRDEEMCRVALENSNDAWEYVPKKFVLSKFFSSPK
jgi:predicted  nucleic acid-binding Zn-ribbon protein